MARILFVWELGGGFGHLARYSGLVAALQKDGHEVVFVARDVAHAEMIFGKAGVRLFQAPMLAHRITNRYSVPHTHAHLLHNEGFGEPASLAGLFKAWRNLYACLQPDLGIFDFSPMALLAARGCRWKRIVSGTGFLIPPCTTPLPAMRYWRAYDALQLADEERRLLDAINALLTSLGEAPLRRVAEIYAVDADFLMTFEEMDHYPQRSAGTYLGMFPPDYGGRPRWPDRCEQRVFAYVHPFLNTEGLLRALASAKGCATVAYAPEVPDTLKKKFGNDRLTFTDGPVSIAEVAGQCRFAITNGTFGTTAAFLICGTPVLCVPTNIERIMVARRVTAMGAGLSVERANWWRLRSAIRSMCTDDSYGLAARRFRKKYAHLDAEWQTCEMINVVRSLLVARSAEQLPSRTAAS